MPDSSFVIFRSLPLSQLPFSVTSVALGARSRKVTVRSGWISGDLIGVGRAACAGAVAGAACCPASGAVALTATSETMANARVRQLFIGIYLVQYLLLVAKTRRGFA